MGKDGDMLPPGACVAVVGEKTKKDRMVLLEVLTYLKYDSHYPY
jgi:hypothetical protein